MSLGAESPQAVAKRSLRLILNTAAASDPLVREAVNALRLEGHLIEVRLIWEPGDATFYAREAVTSGIDVVVAAGGDGTINETVNGLLADAHCPGTALAMMPYGTANDFATSCGITAQAPREALELAARVEPTRVDVVRTQGRYYINVASGGYAAEVTTVTAPEAKQILGGFAYFLTGITNVAGVTARQARIRTPDFNWEGELLGLTVSNGRQAGGGFRVAPQAFLDDGLLDMMIIPNVGWSEFIALANELVRLDARLETEHIVYRQSPWVEIEAPDGLQVNVDGEPLFGSQFRFETVSQCLQCCIPADAPLIKKNAEPTVQSLSR